uniref:Ebetagamma-cat beta subunit n=1 Tax=Bombina maxima TaxID=161274 RepID=B2BRT2_BOMMX|nr:ebetagamma-cat beta subunit [Bombina maxima]
MASKMFFIVTIALAIGCGHGFSDLQIGSLKCAVAAYDRIACPGNTKEQCNARRCCYDNRQSGAIWCFRQRDLRPGCYIDPAERVGCAGEGVTPTECREKGCCFHALTGHVWCYKLNESEDAWKCAVPIKRRVACAGSGVTAAECKAKGCCYNSSTYNTIWCFRPQV